jgi:hypothetical protein
LKTLLNRPRGRASLTALGVACGVVLIAYGILIPVELVFAEEGRHSPSILPPPTARPVVATIVLAAITIAAVAGIWHFRKRGSLSKLSVVPIVIAVCLAFGLMAGDKVSEHGYLSTVKHYFPNVSDQTLKADGHQACDWLRGRHWGRPPVLPRGEREPPEEGPAEQAMLGPGYPTMVIITSTLTLYIYYSRYLDRQNPGPLTQADRLRLQVTYVAWYKLCHFQQWVHRPVQ